MPNSGYKPDYLALGIGVISVFTNLGIWVFWGGRLSQTVVDVAKRQDELTVQMTASNLEVTNEKLAIAVMATKLDYIKSVADTMNGKLDNRRTP